MLAVSWLSVSLGLVVMAWWGISSPGWRRRGVVWRILVVWIRHVDGFESERALFELLIIDAVMGTRL